MAENFCERHGPYDNDLANCPFCEREGKLPSAPAPLQDDLLTIPKGSGPRPPTFSGQYDEVDETVLGGRARYSELGDEATQLPQRRRGEGFSRDDTVVERREEGLLGFLIVKNGSRRGQVHRISAGTTFGRSDARIVLHDPKVSRTHAKFTIEKDHFTLWDFGSENGTFVNGERIRQATAVVENDEIKIGDTIFVLKTLADE